MRPERAACFQLGGVDQRGPQGGFLLDIDHDAGVARASEHFANRVNRFIDVLSISSQGFPLGKGQQSAGEFRSPAGGPANFVCHAVQQWLGGQALHQQFGIAQSYGKHVVEIVGEAGAEFRRRVETLRALRQFFWRSGRESGSGKVWSTFRADSGSFVLVVDAS